MAIINITIQSLLNTAVYDLQTVDTAGTIGDLKTAMETNSSYSADWFDLIFNNQVLDTAQTIGSYGIVEGSQLKIHNKIARLATKEARQLAKLDLAALDRAAFGNARSTYDINQLPNPYNGNDSAPDDGASTLVLGRPWTTTPVGVDNITGYAQMTSSPPLNHPDDFSHTNYTTNEPIGFTFTSPGSPNGFAVSNLSLSNTAWFDTHSPTTITWGPGSTVASSSITVDYYGPGPGPGKTIVIQIVGQVGSATYNFPFTWS